MFIMIFFFDLLNNTAISYSSNAPAGHSGSPGDGQNCTSCHSGTATIQQGWIISNIPVDGYIPGSTYTITATANHSSLNKFGFQVSPQNINGDLLGSLLVVNSSETQLVGSGKYITHTLNGTSGSNNMKSWSFDWIAPSSGTGDVIFYGAFNAVNNNGQSSGDVVYTSTLTVQENTISSLENNKIKDDESFSIYPNPVTDKTTVSFKSAFSYPIDCIEVVNMDGKVVRKIQCSGLNKQEIDLSGVMEGIYFLVFRKLDGVVYTKKIIKR